MVARSGEVVQIVGRRVLDICCSQETRWMGDGVRTTKVAGKNYWKKGMKDRFLGCSDGGKQYRESAGGEPWW